MSYSTEFKTVDLLVSSSAETRAVDAFALSLIKAERQLRRLFTYLVYQFPCFNAADISQLREALGHERVYFEGIERGINTLCSCTVQDLVGSDYARLRQRLNEAIDYRNKIFHGQLTAKRLSREDLVVLVSDIRSWCKALATAAANQVGYDGFGRGSFRKGANADLVRSYKVQFGGIADYAKFIQQHMRRP